MKTGVYHSIPLYLSSRENYRGKRRIFQLLAKAASVGNTQISNFSFGLGQCIIDAIPGGQLFHGIVGLSAHTGGQLPETFVGAMFRRKLIEEEIFSFCFASNHEYLGDGVIVFGTLLRWCYHGEVTYIPAGEKWSVLINFIGVYQGQLLVNSFTAFVDTGTQFIDGPRTEIDKINGLLEVVGILNEIYYVNCNKMPQYPTLLISLSGLQVALTPREYVTVMRNDTGEFCFSAFSSHEQTEWYFGTMLIRNFYTVFDPRRSLIGFAPACFRFE
ncbi:cathepsin D [Clonorchis sinensis]|uniref:Cathepsin D n=1 Tax=Clonorchis sinensis TaxID=79923 RepID=G7YMY7_CLOSI|nr:cathepsin D [Clonorchis sinensis]